MTRIKYATVARARGSNSLVVLRGKKTGHCGFRGGADGEGPFDDPVYSERVVDLPRTMTPNEYREFIEDYDDPDAPLARAVEEVADEHDIDMSESHWLSGGEEQDGEAA